MRVQTSQSVLREDPRKSKNQNTRDRSQTADGPANANGGRVQIVQTSSHALRADGGDDPGIGAPTSGCGSAASSPEGGSNQPANSTGSHSTTAGGRGSGCEGTEASGSCFNCKQHGWGAPNPSWLSSQHFSPDHAATKAGVWPSSEEPSMQTRNGNEAIGSNAPMHPINHMARNRIT